MRTLAPEKPDILVELEMCEALGTLLYDGGIMAQPHIWLLEIGVTREVRSIYAAISIRNQQALNNQ